MFSHNINTSDDGLEEKLREYITVREFSFKLNVCPHYFVLDDMTFLISKTSGLPESVKLYNPELVNIVEMVCGTFK